jgi:hypothetical protein
MNYSINYYGEAVYNSQIIDEMGWILHVWVLMCMISDGYI